MKKKSTFWIVYKQLPKKDRKELMRQYFWCWIFCRYPKVYKWCEKHLKWDTLPF